MPAERSGLAVAWARSESEVREAQRLRHLVFADEMGARLSPLPGTPPGLDVDVFDAYCEHLLVRTSHTDGTPGMTIGTYRVLTPACAQRVGGLYSETEFDLTRLRPLRSKMVELGRSCVHPDHRSGGAILALWGALAEFMVRNRLDTMVGCASISIETADMSRQACGNNCARHTLRRSNVKYAHGCRYRRKNWTAALPSSRPR